MEDKEACPVYPQRTETAQNMQRFHTLAIQPTLFGGSSLTRN